MLKMLMSRHLLGGRYALDERIGAGAMGEVWRARDTVLGRVVAAKVIRPYADPEFHTRFRSEALTLASLQHPNVVEVYDYGQDADTGLVYLIMAYVDGQSLSARIAAVGRLPAGEAMSIIAQAARALDAVHRGGVVHRDVKPGNILIGQGGTVVLADFGIARSAHAVSLTGREDVVGTALYMAPEQIAKQEIRPSIDIYALGVVAYHCLAGHPPFPGSNPVAVAMQHMQDEPPLLSPDVPDVVCRLVATAMAKEPAGRFASAGVMAEAAECAGHEIAESVTVRRSMPASSCPAPIEVAMAGVRPVSRPASPDVSDRPPSWTPQHTRSSRARRPVVGAFGITGLVLAGLTTAMAFYGPDAQSRGPSGSADPSTCVTSCGPGPSHTSPSTQPSTPAGQGQEPVVARPGSPYVPPVDYPGSTPGPTGAPGGGQNGDPPASGTDDPGASDPVVDDPVADDPVADDPVADDPVADDPVADDPGDDDPGDDDEPEVD